MKTTIELEGEQGDYIATLRFDESSSMIGGGTTPAAALVDLAKLVANIKWEEKNGETKP